MMLTPNGLSMENGERIKFLCGYKYHTLKAVSPLNCDVCVLAGLAACEHLNCLPFLEKGPGVHFVKVEEEETA